MNIDNIVNGQVTLDSEGKSMLLGVYENRIKELEEENKKLKEVQCIFCGTGCLEKRKELENRINKAIDYIEELYTRYIADYSDIERLEKILKGEE